MNPRTAPVRRRGFTLIEMLVTLAIFLTLATLAVALMPRVAERQRATQGASQLQGWLAVAKQWAKRDRMPRGLRLMPGTLYPNLAGPNTCWVHDLVYIDQPADFTGGKVSTSSSLTAVTAWDGTQVRAFTPPVYEVSAGTGVDFSGGFGAAGGPPTTAAAAAMWAVGIGDYLQFTDNLSTNLNNNLFRIVGLASPTTLVLDHGGIAHPSTNSYSIMRAPRPRPGEAPLTLPDNVAIDLTTNVTYSNALTSSVKASGYTPPPYVDILFDPSGVVTHWSGEGDKIQLWVRDISQDPVSGSTAMFNGDQLVITVYVRSGMIAAHPVDTTQNTLGTQYSNPYSFTQDARSSGF